MNTGSKIKKNIESGPKLRINLRINRRVSKDKVSKDKMTNGQTIEQNVERTEYRTKKLSNGESAEVPEMYVIIEYLLFRISPVNNYF